MRLGLGKDVELWNLLLPQGAELARWQYDDRRRIVLHFPGRGQITIGYYTRPWISGIRSQPARVLSDGQDKGLTSANFYVFGTRIEVQASFENLLRHRNEVFSEWATGLMASLEEALDWRFYLQTRHGPHRIRFAVEDRRLAQ